MILWTKLKKNIIILAILRKLALEMLDSEKGISDPEKGCIRTKPEWLIATWKRLLEFSSNKLTCSGIGGDQSYGDGTILEHAVVDTIPCKYTASCSLSLSWIVIR